MNFDWSHARAFMVAAEQGTLTRAADVLGLTQPTVGRQVSAFEQDLNMVLFDRVGRSLHLTQDGRAVLGLVQRMDQAATDIARLSDAHHSTLDGVVRLTASDIVSAYVLPQVLTRLRDTAPKLRIEIIARNDLQDLLRREADIAIRHVRPEQPELIARKIGMRQASLYASRDYITTHGHPRNVQDLQAATWITMADPTEMIAYMQQFGITLQPENFGIYSENGVVGWEYARHGFGICVMTDEVGAQAPDMVKFEDFMNFEYPVWLVAHRDLHHSPRMRLLFDLVADHIMTIV